MELKTFVKLALISLDNMGVVGTVNFDIGLDPLTRVQMDSSNRVKFTVELGKADTALSDLELEDSDAK